MRFKLPKLKIGLPRFRFTTSPKSYNSQTSLWRLIFTKEVGKKILFTLFIVFIYRLLSAVPLPGINMDVYLQQFADKSSSQINYFLTVFTGGSLETPSIVGLGIGVYITASIIIQLLSSIVPRLEELSKEGNRGKQVIDQYTRYLTVPLSFVYSIGYLFLATQDPTTGQASPLSNLIPRLPDGSFSIPRVLFMALVLTAGSLFLMWLSELITENGIGNGSSILIMVSILSNVPAFIGNDLSALNIGGAIGQVFQGRFEFLTDPSMVAVYLIAIGIIVLTIGTVIMSESTRKIQIQYARRERMGGETESVLPLKLNQSGVLPIIFASALLTFPRVIIPILERIVDPVSEVGRFLSSLNTSFLFDSTQPAYWVIYFVAIMLLSLLYANIALKPEQVAENLQKSGGFIPGIRPGKTTESYISITLLRLTFAGSIFLGVIALIPLVAGSALFQLSGYQFTLFSAIGGTSILIVVGVILDTIRQLQSLRATQSYERYL